MDIKNEYPPVRPVVKLLGFVAVAGALAFSFVGIRGAGERRAAELKAEQAASDKEEQEREGKFFAAMDELVAKRQIADAGRLKKAYTDYYASPGANEIVSLAVGVYKKDPAAGLRVLEEVCLVFDNNAEMSEGIAEEVNTLLYKDKDTFAKGLSKLDGSKFKCLAGNMNLGWIESSQAESFDSNLENKKLAAYLKAGRFKENPNVQILVSALER